MQNYAYKLGDKNHCVKRMKGFINICIDLHMIYEMNFAKG